MLRKKYHLRRKILVHRRECDQLGYQAFCNSKLSKLRFIVPRGHEVSTAEEQLVRQADLQTWTIKRCVFQSGAEPLLIVREDRFQKSACALASPTQPHAAVRDAADLS